MDNNRVPDGGMMPLRFNSKSKELKLSGIMTGIRRTENKNFLSVNNILKKII